jgi:D,D-heptose 1,7-bisphosphate phosphatase
MQMPSSPDATLTQAVLLVEDSARVLTPLAGKPVLTWKMRELQRFGVEDFIVLGMAEDAAQSDLDHASFGLPKPPKLRFGPRGRWQDVTPYLQPRFLLSSADMLFDGNVATLLRDFAADGVAAPPRMLTHAPEGVACGNWALRRDALDLAADIGGPRDAVATSSRGFLADLRTGDGVHAAAHDLPAILHRPALFLDRDGVLNRDHGYVSAVSQWEWVPGAREAVKLAVDCGWHVFVVTNQSGVARGLYAEEAVQSLLVWMADAVRRFGGTIDDTRYCPYHPEATVPAYRQDSDWRKPGPGMILSLVASWELALQHCVLVGDQDTDMQAAEAAGITGVLFDGVNLYDTVAGIVAPEAGVHAHG